MSTTTRTDNVGSPENVDMTIHRGPIDTSSSYPTTTTRTDRGTEGDPEVVTNVSMVINSPSKSVG